MSRKVLRLAASFAVLYGATAGIGAWALQLQVLSSFPELVTGGDAAPIVQRPGRWPPHSALKKASAKPKPPVI
jgi:hypothetical protein